jgi:hypothetical protein
MTQPEYDEMMLLKTKLFGDKTVIIIKIDECQNPDRLRFEELIDRYLTSLVSQDMLDNWPFHLKVIPRRVEQ